MLLGMSPELFGECFGVWEKAVGGAGAEWEIKKHLCYGHLLRLKRVSAALLVEVPKKEFGVPHQCGAVHAMFNTATGVPFRFGTFGFKATGTRCHWGPILCAGPNGLPHFREVWNSGGHGRPSDRRPPAGLGGHADSIFAQNSP